MSQTQSDQGASGEQLEGRNFAGATRPDRSVSRWVTRFRARRRRRAYPEYAEHDAKRPTSYPSERHFAGIAAELVTRRD